MGRRATTIRHGAAILALWVAAIAAAVLYGAGWETDNRLARWVGQLGAQEGWRLLVERFGGDEFVVVRVAGADLGAAADREALGELRRALAGEPAVSRCVDALALAGSGDVRADPVVRALDLVDPDAARYDLLLAVRPEATPGERARLVDQLEERRAWAARRGWELLRAGHPLVAAALDAEARAAERRFAPALVLLAVLAAALLLRSGSLALAVLLPAALASAVPRAALRALGVDSDLLLVVVGPLGFVLLFASTLHLATAFARHLPGRSAAEARRAAVREKLAAGLLAAATTAAGFGVFLASELLSLIHI